MPRLDALIEDLDANVRGDPGTEIRSICYDSRQVSAGALFVALPGAHTDGHDYIVEALERGAAALLVERPVESTRRGAIGCPLIEVSDTRRALSRVAARFFSRPAEELRLAGVTGTNGKTSTVRMIESIALAAGRNAASIGTISTRFAGREIPATLTTPESLDIQATLREMRDAQVEWVAMEVSSHALAAGRVDTLRFDVAVFTNLTQDHLDFHGDMESYGRAKAELFGDRLLHGPAVLNAGDPYTAEIASAVTSRGGRVIHYGRHGREPTYAPLDVFATDARATLTGSSFTLHTPDGEAQISLPLAGDFQIENALAAAAACIGLGLGCDEIARGLSRCPAVPGRAERVSDEAPAVLVDYAHTPDALEQVLARLRPLAKQRLITVFGCGGDRDATKRAPMARAACLHSDYVIATSDNPRSEDPAAILRDVAVGLSGAFEILPDRHDAISRAIALAEDDDLVVIAGKGHETVQIVGRERRPFDDRAEARSALARRRATPERAR